MTQQYSALVIEDEVDGAAVVDWMLKSQKIKTTIVGDAEAALAQLQKTSDGFSVVLVDLALPGMDGFQLLEHLKAQAGNHIHTIAMTAFHTPELREKALSAGFDAYVAKPIDKGLLVKALDSILSQT